MEHLKPTITSIAARPSVSTAKLIVRKVNVPRNDHKLPSVGSEMGQYARYQSRPIWLEVETMNAAAQPATHHSPALVKSPTFPAPIKAASI